MEDKMRKFYFEGIQRRQDSHIGRIIACSKLIVSRNNRRGKLKTLQNSEKDQEILFEKT